MMVSPCWLLLALTTVGYGHDALKIPIPLSWLASGARWMKTARIS
jgi:hypothetical protein